MQFAHARARGSQIRTRRKMITRFCLIIFIRISRIHLSADGVGSGEVGETYGGILAIFGSNMMEKMLDVNF